MNTTEINLIDRRVRGRDLYKALEYLLAELPEDITITIKTHHEIVRAMNLWDELDRKQNNDQT